MKKQSQLVLLIVTCWFCLISLPASLDAQPTEPKGPSAGIDVRARFTEPADAKQPLNEVESPLAEEESIKVFHLEHANAEKSAQLVKQFNLVVQVAADPRTNSLITFGPEDQLNKLEAILLLLDERTSKNSSQTAERRSDALEGADGLPSNPSPRRSVDSIVARQIPRSPETQSLVDELSRVEIRAAALAEQIRARLKEPNTLPSQLEPMRAQLDAALTDALTIKVKLEHLQVKAMEERITRLKMRIEQRALSTRKIVERRARELIDGDASQWSAIETDSLPGFPNPANLSGQSADDRASNLQEANRSEDTISTVTNGSPVDDDRPKRNRNNADDSALARSPFSSYQHMASSLSETILNLTLAEEALHKLEMANKNGLERNGTVPISDEVLWTAKHRIEAARISRDQIQNEYKRDQTGFGSSNSGSAIRTSDGGPHEEPTRKIGIAEFDPCERSGGC